MIKKYKNNKLKIVCIFILGCLILLNVVVFYRVIFSEHEKWNLILVNADNPIPEDYMVQVVEISDGILVDARIEKKLSKMMDAAKENGVNLKIVSGYRTKEQQEKIYQDEIGLFLQEGYEQVVAEKLAKQWVAVPGTSEHETGLAVDINPDEQNTDRDNAYSWLAQNAAQYGFVRRYPKDKELITGIVNEPWHYRYVGKENAIKMVNKNLCLEEYKKTKEE